MKVLLIVSVVLAFASAQNKPSFTLEELSQDLGVTLAEGRGLSVKFGSQKVKFGDEFDLRQVENQPQVKWKSQPGAMYTMVMVDPDAPSNSDPKFR